MDALCIIIAIIFILVCIIQRGQDESLTREGYQRSIDRDTLVYYDQIHHCYRSTKTNEKANKYLAHDIDGEPYEYVISVPPFKSYNHGRFIEAKYICEDKKGEPIKYRKEERQMFFGS